MIVWLLDDIFVVVLKGVLEEVFLVIVDWFVNDFIVYNL